MTPQFLRSEAARFREMADTITDREASRQRLLAMAADYEARARTAEAAQPPEQLQEATPEAAPEPASEPVTEELPDDKGQRRPKLRLSRRTTSGEPRG